MDIHPRARLWTATDDQHLITGCLAGKTLRALADSFEGGCAIDNVWWRLGVLRKTGRGSSSLGALCLLA